MNHQAERIGFYACCVVAAAPLLFAHYPPMVDLPQHAAQVATLSNLLHPGFTYQDLFTIEWVRPYLLGYLVTLGLSQFMSIVAACKVVIAATVIAIPLTAARLRAAFRGDCRWDWFLLPISYGFAFQWGLFNFFVGLPFVFLFLTCAVRYAEKPSLRRGLVLAACAHALLLVHLLIAACACGLAAVYVLAGRLAWKARLAAALPFISPAPVVLTWAVWVLHVSGQANEPGPWRLSLLRPIWLLTSSLALPTTLTNIAVALAVVSLPFVLGARFTRERPRQAMFVVYLLWMMLGPDYLLGNYLTYQRFAILAVPLFLVALQDPDPGKRLGSPLKMAKGLVFALPVALITLTCVLFAAFDRESSAYSEIESQMKPGKRVLGMMFNPQTILFEAPMFLHYASWYQAERHGVADFSFAQFGLVVCYKPSAILVPRGFEWFPQTFDWQRNAGWRYDYFLVRADREVGAFVFRQASSQVRLAAQRPPWYLYERVPTAVALSRQPEGAVRPRPAR